MIRRYSLAAVRDAARAVATMVQFVALEPAWCRLVGCEERTIATPEVITLCVRCGAQRAG